MEQIEYVSDLEEIGTDDLQEEILYRIPYSEKKSVYEAKIPSQNQQGKKAETPIKSEKEENTLLLQIMDKVKALEADTSKVNTHNMDSVVCYHCSATGHYARDCLKRKQGGQDNRNRQYNNNGRGTGYTGPGNGSYRNVNRAHNSRGNHLN